MIKRSLYSAVALSLCLVSCDRSVTDAPKAPPETRSRKSVLFAAQIAKFKDSSEYLGRTSSITDIEVHRGQRALFVVSNIEAAKNDLLTVGSIHIQVLPSGLRTLCQVIAETEKERLIIMQPVDDVLAGRFEINHAIQDDEPWKSDLTLGKGGQGIAYKWRDFVVKSGSDENQKWKRYLKLANIEGMIRVRGFTETSTHQGSTYFELLEHKDLGFVTPDRFNHIVSDLIATLRSIHDIGEKHGDISPKNIMFRGEKPVFIDLGTGSGTPGYSMGRTDDVALAISLIDMRHAEQFRKDALDCLSLLFKVLEPVVTEIRISHPDLETQVQQKGATLQTYLALRFLRAGQIFDDRYKPDTASLEDFEKWRKKAFTEENERATRGIRLSIQKYIQYRDMDCESFRTLLDKRNLRLLSNLGLEPLSKYPPHTNGHCDVDIVNDYKIALANAHAQMSLAGAPLDDDIEFSKSLIRAALDKMIYEDLEKISPTDSLLVKVARFRGKF